LSLPGLRFYCACSKALPSQSHFVQRSRRA